MQTFYLQRDEDETGISGTGRVAEGVIFTDGEVVIRWQAGEYHSTVVWAQGLEAVEAIHGHGGKTRIVFDQDPMADIISGDLNPERRDPDGHRYDGQPCECGSAH